MAVAKSGILGDLNGSVGNLTFYNLGGSHVVRERAVQVFNPQTPKQEASRANMSFAIEVFNQLKPFLKFSLINRMKKQSLLSEFLRLNLNKSIINSVLYIDDFKYYSSNSENSVIVIDEAELANNLVQGTII